MKTMDDQRVRQELERLLSNNSLSYLSNQSLAREQQLGEGSRYSNYQEERANLFRGCPSSCGGRGSSASRPNPRPGTSTSSSHSLSGQSVAGGPSSYSAARSYEPSHHFAGRGRGRPRTLVSRPTTTPYKHRAKKKKEISKDIYLLNSDATAVDHGPKEADLFENGQVQIAIKLDTTSTS